MPFDSDFVLHPCVKWYDDHRWQKWFMYNMLMCGCHGMLFTVQEDWTALFRWVLAASAAGTWPRYHMQFGASVWQPKVWSYDEANISQGACLFLTTVNSCTIFCVCWLNICLYFIIIVGAWCVWITPTLWQTAWLYWLLNKHYINVLIQFIANVATSANAQGSSICDECKEAEKIIRSQIDNADSQVQKLLVVCLFF